MIVGLICFVFLVKEQGFRVIFQRWDVLVFVFAQTFYQMRPVYSPALDSAALCSPSCIGPRLVFDFLLTKCSLLTKYLYSPQLIYFNSHSLSFFLSLSSPSLLFLPSKWLFIAAFQIKVHVTPPPSKMNADLSVQ